MATGLRPARAQRLPALRFDPDGLAPPTVAIVTRIDGAQSPSSDASERASAARTV
jgi:hypothetical protein